MAEWVDKPHRLGKTCLNQHNRLRMEARVTESLINYDPSRVTFSVVNNRLVKESRGIWNVNIILRIFTLVYRHSDNSGWEGPALA